MCVCQTKDRMLYQLRSKVELSKSPTYSNNHSVWLFHATGFSHFWSCSNMLHRVTFSIHSTVACLTPAMKFIICYKWFLSPRRVSFKIFETGTYCKCNCPPPARYREWLWIMFYYLSVKIVYAWSIMCKHAVYIEIQCS